MSLRFVRTSQQDMHVHQWLHHLAGRVCSAACRLDDYQQRRDAVLQALREVAIPDCHRRYVGNCAWAKLGHGGGL